ncbi:MAG TPA: electron transfer flavoprotein subunit alpha/FixB family protein [Victivallales bacterium]|nr:electron transfer flavoprotein subunit alpha/FixB family protein [Victivallales bacterium]
MSYKNIQSNYSGIWIIAEHENNAVLPGTYELLSRGTKLAKERNTELTAVLIGGNFDENILLNLLSSGADKILIAEHKLLDHFLVETYSKALVELINKYSPEIIISAATTAGRTLMPYVAMKIHAGITADCTELKIEESTGLLLQTRPAIGGNIMATIKTPVYKPQIATVRTSSSLQVKLDSSDNINLESKLTVYSPNFSSEHIRTEFLKLTPYDDIINIQDANIVVSVGKGIKKAENIKIVREFADSIGAAIGASREVIDRGWLSYSHQVGLSGKTISPDLYIALGISGAIQHLAGMQTSKNIIAVNKDPDAHIFEIADFGIVGDLFEVIPHLTDLIKNNVK